MTETRAELVARLRMLDTAAAFVEAVRQFYGCTSSGHITLTVKLPQDFDRSKELVCYDG